MRKMIGICVGIILEIWIPSSLAMTFTGQVVDNKARPVQGAEVVVCERERSGPWDEDTRMISPVVRTDAGGRFALDAGVTRQRDVFIVARKAGLAHAWEWLNSSNNVLSRKHFPLVLEPACVLAGQVVDPDGGPVAGAEVQATPLNTWGFSGVIDLWAIPGPGPWFTVKTDAEGRFRFEQLAADVSAGLRVQAPGGGSHYVFRPHESESIGFDVGGSDIQLTLPREGTIRGRVVDGQGGPVSGVDLMVHSGCQYSDITNLYLARKTKSDQTGTSTFAGVPEGPQQIEVLAPEREPPSWTGRAEKISVKASEVTEVTVRVDKGGVLEVTAFDARTRRPVAGARVDASGQQGHHVQFAITDAKGRACVRVPPDSYTVYVSAAQFSHCQSTVKVVEGRAVRREALLPAFPRVSGRVLDRKGRPVPDIVVAVHPFGDHVYTDAQGKFDAGYSEQFGVTSRLVVARDVKKGLAATRSVDTSSGLIDLTLGPAWTLIGRVADPNGVGIAAARVSLRLDVQNCLSDPGVEVLTDPEGRFEMKAIPPVQKDFEYRICASAAGYGQAHLLKTFLSGPPGACVDLGAIRLPFANVSAFGVVVDAKGVPAARVPVFLSDWPGNYQPRKNAVTNERGEFTFTRLCQGPVRFQANFGNSPGGPSFLKTRSPAQNVRIVLGKDLTDPPKTSTLNTAPAQLTDLCPYLSALQTDGRPLLLCLIDPQQQPSRQCLIDLAQKADTLAARGVIAVEVLTSKVDFQQHDAFRKANRITFPRYPVGDDFEARHAAWGIQSLPWLILTDRKHTVIAQGFALDQLADKIKEVDHAKP